MHWPGAGVSAAGITGLGVIAGPGAHRQVPIASVAKVMTAYLVLRDHPLSPGQQGPDIIVRTAEAAAYPAEVRGGYSLVPVSAGERISERHALEALLLPSADNMAWILARWDAGSQARFVARMNATARALGMTATRYTDPSGLAASTVSSAADQVVLGQAAMRQPALAAIAAKRSAVIPVAGQVRNLNSLLGQDGIAGLKTGSDSAAGGCVLLASWRDVRGGRSRVLIVAAVLGQPGSAETILPHALEACCSSCSAWATLSSHGRRGALTTTNSRGRVWWPGRRTAKISGSWNTELRLMPSAVTVKTWSVCSSYPSPTRR